MDKTQRRILSVKLHRDTDPDPDLSHLGEYTKHWQEGAIDRQERGDMRHGELRYFVPAMTGEETGNPDSPEQDYQRAEDYNRGGWCMVGICATAEIVVAGVVQTIYSGGLWGIESDSDASYFAEVEAAELAGLRDELRALGFKNRTIHRACYGVQQAS